MSDRAKKIMQRTWKITLALALFFPVDAVCAVAAGSWNERLLELLPDPKGRRILFLGTGNAADAEAAARLAGPDGRVEVAYFSPGGERRLRELAGRPGLQGLRPVEPPRGLPREDGGPLDLLVLDMMPGLLCDRARWLAAWRARLAPGGIAVVRLWRHDDLDFGYDDFADVPALLRRALEEAPDGELRSRLRHLKAAGYERVNPARVEELTWALVADFNEIVDDVGFLAAALPVGGLAETAGLTTEEAVWAQDSLGLFAAPEGYRVPREPMVMQRMQIVRLNKLLLVARFRPWLARQDEAPYLSADQERRGELDSEAVRREFESAGFRLRRRVLLAPFSVVYLFDRG